MAFTRIEQADLLNKGVIGLPDTPGLSTAAMQEKLEETARSVIIPKHNALLDELEDTTSASNLGASAPTGRPLLSPTVQGVMDKLSSDLKVVEDGMAEAIADAHTHDNKALLDTYTQTEADLAQAVADDHTHSNKALLDSYTQTESDLAQAVADTHTHANKSLLDSYTQSESDIADAVTKKHEHSNKSLLDDYTQSETNLADAVAKKHDHSNKALLDTYTQTESALAQAVADDHTHSNKTVIDKFGEDSGGNPTYDGNPIGGGGSASDTFKNIVSGGTTFVASGNNDTFKINAGSNVTITPLSSPDKGIQISATGGGQSTGDMLMADYDSQGDVKTAGGIDAYVSSAISGKVDTAGDGLAKEGTTIALDLGMLTGSNLTKAVSGKDIKDALDEKADTSDIPTPAEKATWDAKVSESLLKDTVGWVGKNKWNPENMTGTNSVGNTWTKNSDKSVTLNGTTTGDFIFPSHEGSIGLDFYDIEGGKTYKFTTKTVNSNIELQVYCKETSSSSWSRLAQDVTSGNELVFTTPSSFYDIWIRILVRSGKTLNNVTVYPMITDASITDSTFEPHHPSVEQTLRDAEVIEGKNKLQIPDSVVAQTINGVTFTVNRDSNGNVLNVTVNGTATAVTVFVMSTYTYAQGEYILSGCPSGGNSGTTYAQQIRDLNNATIINDEGNSKSGTLSGGVSYRAVIRIGNGYTANNLTFYPMLCTPDEWNKSHDFEPYYIPLKDSKMSWEANAKTGVHNYYNHNGTTKTIQGVTFTVNSDKSITVNRASAGSDTARYDFQATLPAGTYKGNCCPSGGSDGTYWCIIRKNNGDGDYIGSDTGSGFTFTLTEETVVNTRILVGTSTSPSNMVFKPLYVSIEDTYDGYTAPAMTNRELTEIANNRDGVIQVGKLVVLSKTFTLNADLVVGWNENRTDITFPKPVIDVPILVYSSGNYYHGSLGTNGKNIRMASAISSGASVNINTAYICQ